MFDDNGGYGRCTVHRAEDGTEMMGIFCPKMNGYQSWVKDGSGHLWLPTSERSQFHHEIHGTSKIEGIHTSKFWQVASWHLVWQGSICQPLWHAHGPPATPSSETILSSSPIITSPLMGAQTSTHGWNHGWNHQAYLHLLDKPKSPRATVQNLKNTGW